MAVKTWVGRFAIAQGQPQEEGPYLRSFPRQRPDEEEDELYVLVEPADTGSEEYCSQLVDAIGRMYRQDALSVTGAVLRALRAAHQQLRDWNERSLREHQVAAGVNCLAVQGRTAYLAQVGPSVAYYVGDGRCHRITPEDAAAEPLGHAEGAEPTFSRYELSPGDLLLLVPSRINELIDEDTLRSILVRGADAALVELFRLVRDEQEFSLVLLACVIEPETDTPAPAEPEEVAAATPDSVEDGVETAVTDSPAPLLDPAAVGVPPPGLTEPKVRLKGAEADIRYPRTTGLRATLPRVPRLALLGLFALVVLSLLGWYFLPSALEESREDRYADLIADARLALDNAEAAADPDQRRLSLVEAERSLADAEALQPESTEVADLRSLLDGAFAELNAVLVLTAPDLIVDVSERVPGAISLGELELGGGGAYFLDREEGRVIVITLLAPNPEPIVLLKAGDSVGTAVAGPPQHIAWAAELGALLVLDDTRQLISVTPGQEPQLLALRDAEAWGSADGIGYAGGSLYVLDRAGNQVWRYRPTETGFDSEREPLLTSIDLEQAVELAVADALYLLLDDGTVLRSLFGVEEAFSQAGIDQALASPTSPVPLPSSGRLLVADRGNDRIVVFSSDGTFLQQWVSPTTFTDLRAIAVDEANGNLYILVGGALYRTSLPSPPS